MKVSNAIKKVEKATKSKAIENNGSFKFIVGRQYLKFSRNGRSDEVVCIHTGRVDDEPDSMTDYFPMIWHDNITQAIRFLDI